MEATVNQTANQVTVEQVEQTKRTIMNKVKHTAVDGTSSVLGAGHLIFQSLADGCANAEAFLKKKAYGMDPEQVREQRLMKTFIRQELAKEKLAKMKEVHKLVLSKRKEARDMNISLDELSASEVLKTCEKHMNDNVKFIYCIKKRRYAVLYLMDKDKNYIDKSMKFTVKYNSIEKNLQKEFGDKNQLMFKL